MLLSHLSSELVTHGCGMIRKGNKSLKNTHEPDWNPQPEGCGPKIYVTETSAYSPYWGFGSKLAYLQYY